MPDGFLPVASLRAYPPYARFLEDLAALGRIITFDRRGLGASPWTPRYGQLTVAAWAEDARTVLDSLRTTAAVVIGLAEGAITAIALAATHPERVAAMILLNATPGPLLTPLARYGVGPRHIELLRSSPSRWAELVPGIELVAPSLGRDQSFAVWLHQAFLAVGGTSRVEPAFELTFRSDVRNLLPRVQAPTLVVHRREDAWFSPEHGRVIARAIDGARYLELPGADHAPYVGNTTEIIDAIAWFLRALPATTAAQSPHGPVARALTSRQAQIVKLAATGLADKEIASQIGLSTRTVQKHLENAYRRLGVQNRTSAAHRSNIHPHN